ncbi:MAG: long-chain fatty acid--CoA ligase [Candidatus Rokubacteria bacterium]|nr:long-chain fatty acid--CoA ligase [Candidatus Rokubacteria bacterium]
MATPETLARVLFRRVEQSSDAVAELLKRDGRWERLTWREVGTIVREVALGLLALGRGPGEPIAILSRSRAEWVHADLAIFAVGDVTVPIYPTFTDEQVTYIVRDVGARALFVEDREVLDRILGLRDRMPTLADVVVIAGEPEASAGALGWNALRRRGRGEAERLAPVLAERAASARSEDVATIVYTSGTTGDPKGVIQTHANHLATLAALAQLPGVRRGDTHLLFLPLAHSFARLEALMAIHRGLVTAFAESVDRVAQNLGEVHPDFVFAVPRLFEKAQARILASVASGSVVTRRLFAWAMYVGRRVSALEQARRPVPLALRAEHRLAHRTVLSKLTQAFGGRLRFAVSGGAPLAREIAEFFHAAGVLIVEGYGLTETCPALTFNRIDNFRFGSVGQAIPGVELRIAPDGEILARGPNVATRGYLGKPAETAEAFRPDGWLATGDLGRLDDEGFLWITDRKKDLIVTSGGANIAPQPIENGLRTDPIVNQAVVIGDRRPYPVALLTLDPGELRRLARDRGILVTDPGLLLRHPEIVARVDRAVAAVNARLQSYARVKRFAVLPGELTEDAGELTPTQKVRRRYVAEKYRAEIEALYRAEWQAGGGDDGRSSEVRIA